MLITLWVAFQQGRALRADLKVRLQLQFGERFDRLMDARNQLAERIRVGATRDTISEDVMNFFEDLGMYLGRGYLDEELVWNTFGFYAVRWWLACKDYVLLERRRHNDQTLFKDFENLAAKMRAMFAPNWKSQLRRTLKNSFSMNPRLNAAQSVHWRRCNPDDLSPSPVSRLLLARVLLTTSPNRRVRRIIGALELTEREGAPARILAQPS